MALGAAIQSAGKPPAPELRQPEAAREHRTRRLLEHVHRPPIAILVWTEDPDVESASVAPAPRVGASSSNERRNLARPLRSRDPGISPGA